MNLRSATWDNDLANRLTGRQVPGYFEVVGQANATANVTVNTAATYRHGEYFRKEVAVANTLVPVYSTVNVLAQWGTTNETTTGYQFVPKTPENFVYDDDGNLTQDGRWTYTWDAENRLITMTTRADVAVTPVRRIEFQYDWQGRRIAKLVYDARTGGTLLSTARYLYDGWNLLMELNGSNAKVRGFVWGTDLSGTMQGAGGVGGLLKVTYYGTATTNCFVGYDGNGNVTLLADAATGAVLAQYEYGPFGETIRITGPSTGSMAKANPFRFSTKYQDEETDLLYYGYRYYNASTGRWTNPDPLEEDGGLNLYAFAINTPVNVVDILGLESMDDGQSGFARPFSCHRSAIRAELDAPQWVMTFFRKFGLYKAKTKLNLQYQRCWGCCKNGAGNGKAFTLRGDLMAEGEAGTPEVDYGFIKIRAGWYFRATGNAGVNFTASSCHAQPGKGACVNASLEGGVIISASNYDSSAEAGGRAGLNLTGTACVSCTAKQCKVQFRACGSGRGRVWMKVKIFGRYWEYIEEAQSPVLCTPWATVLTVDL